MPPSAQFIRRCADAGPATSGSATARCAASVASCVGGPLRASLLRRTIAIRLPNGEVLRSPHRSARAAATTHPARPCCAGGKCCDPRYVRDGRCFTPTTRKRSWLHLSALRARSWRTACAVTRARCVTAAAAALPASAWSDARVRRAPVRPAAARVARCLPACVCDSANVQNGQCIPLRRVGFISTSRPHHCEESGPHRCVAFAGSGRAGTSPTCGVPGRVFIPRSFGGGGFRGGSRGRRFRLRTSARHGPRSFAIDRPAIPASRRDGSIFCEDER